MTTGVQTGIPARQVGAVLAAQWRELAEALRAAGEFSPPWHVHSATMIVLAGRVTVEDLEADLDALARTAPGRLLVVVDEPEAPPGITADVAISCTVDPASGVRLCHERVTLRRCGGAGGIESVLLALRTPDVPSGLWWRGDPPWDSPDLEAVFRGRLAEIVLIDSERFAEPSSGLARLAAVMRDGWPVRDLNWSRLSGWRAMIAACFDDAERAGWLAALSAIRVTCMGDPAAGALIAGWLGHRLELIAGPQTSTLESTGGERIPVEFASRTAARTGLSAVRLSFRERAEEVLVERTGDGTCTHAVVTGSGGRTCERATRLLSESGGALAARELTRQSGPAPAPEIYGLAASILERSR